MAGNSAIDGNGHLPRYGVSNGSGSIPSGGILGKVLEFAKENPIAVVLGALVVLGILVPEKKN